MIELTPFQDEDERWMLEHPKNMILYDKGLGKTVLATKRNIDLSIGTSIVSCPTGAFRTWKDHAISDEFGMWPNYRPKYDVDVFYVRGNRSERTLLWGELANAERTFQHRLFICTHNALREDLPTLSKVQLKHIDQIDIDEAHKMRNRKSILYKNFKPIARRHKYFSFLSGTPISRGPQEFFTYLNCIDPQYFSSYWAFLDMFCETVEGTYGREIIGPKNTERFNQLMSMYTRSRRKTDPEIAAQMPPKYRTPIFCNLTRDQNKIYTQLGTTSWVIKQDGSGGIILAGGSLEQQMRWRQLLVCPKILDQSLDMGGAFDAFLSNIGEPGSNDGHTVLFTPFKSAFSHFREALEKEKYHVSQISGGITSEEQDHAIATWQNNKGILLCTIAKAESFHLPVPTCHFIGYSWDPNENEQAEDRLHRWITKWPVTAYYYRYEGTVDDDLCDAVNFKTRQTTGFFQRFHDYQKEHGLTII